MARLCGKGIQAEALALYVVYSRVWREGVQAGSLERYIVLARVWTLEGWGTGGIPWAVYWGGTVVREGLQAGSLAPYVINMWCLYGCGTPISRIGTGHMCIVHTKMAFLGRTMAWALPMATLGCCCAMRHDMGSCYSYVPCLWSYTAGHLVAHL